MWTMLLSGAAIYPVLLWVYLRRFDQRRALITDLFQSGDTMAVYQKAHPLQSHSSQGKPRQEDVPDANAALNDVLRLDLPAYWLHTLLCGWFTLWGLIIAVCVGQGGNTLALPAPLQKSLSTIPASAVIGYAGALLWGQYEFVDRLRFLNLTPASLHTQWLRILLLAVLGGLVQHPLAAFALATLPLAGISQALAHFATKKLDLAIAPAATVSPLWELVQGLTPGMIARLQDAGVESVAQLANQDPARIMRRTNFDWRTVLDLMD